MKNYNDLVLSYYAAVDSGNESLAEKLLAEVLDVVKNDGRVLAQISKYKIDYHGKADVLAELNVVIWDTSRYPEKRWHPSKGAKFSTWIVTIAHNKADDYSGKLGNRKRKYQSLDLLDFDPSTTQALSCGKKLISWNEMVTPKAWNRLSPDQQYILEKKREGIKGKKIAEDLGWDPTRVTKEKKKAINKLIKVSPDELGSFNGVDFYRIMFVDASLMVRNN
jgi:DNA-directed RNA polymerase specialized sigma24 family protein